MAARQTRPVFEGLDEIPGAGRLGVQLILAEIGADMTPISDRRAPGANGSRLPD
ncbi:hypothetical protein [Mycobacterium intracellulare]|nr:hypothetical protein [Mycobacterium intracellulare]MDV6985570.1 hypothetical protein [Mycobacterium intracellulare]MDV7015798.1 hypothetical protein [Mycobacterium intracellulare]